MPKILFTIILLFSVQTHSQVNVELLNHYNPHPSDGYNDIWGYVDGSGNEYALLGVQTGTSIIDLSNPSNPQEVEFIPGPVSVWRDIKVHEHYAYIVTEQTGTGQGLQIIDLSDLPNSATLVNTIDTYFARAHNIYIDNGYAFVIGTDGGGGMHILDLSDPVNPVETAYYSGSNYIHDVYVWNDTVVACAEDSYDLVDITDKNNPFLISSSGSATPPGIYAHSGWMTEDKRYFYATEEFNQVDLTVWDLQDRNTWDLVLPSWQMPSNSTIHNLFIKGSYAHISYYSEGYVVLDISDPVNPYLIGHYDTESAWGCYPFLPSGITLISDIITGLYVLQFSAGNVPPSINHTPVDDILNNDPITIMATIIDNSSVTDANLHYRTTFQGVTGDWTLVNDLNGPNGSDYEFIIPGQEHLTTVEYYLAAVDDEGDLTTLPAGGSGINPPGSTPPPDLFEFNVVIPGTPIITYFVPTGDTTVYEGSEFDFEVQANDTSGLELNYKWYKNGVFVGLGNIYHYRHSAFNPPPTTDVIKVIVSNDYIDTEKIWNVYVEPLTDINQNSNPVSYELNQNYPNPFNPSTAISFSIPENRFVNLTVYNLIGQKVATLVNETLPPGNYTKFFDASGFTSGIYIAKINAGNYSKAIKMTLVK